MKQVAVVTGAGSGVGRAIALKLAEQNWQVVLIGRKAASLEKTLELGRDKSRFHMIPCDVSDEQAVNAMAAEVLKRYGTVQVLVNGAGTNVPQRALPVLSGENHRHIIDVNMNGAFYCAQAFLPSMRKQASGTIVNIVSDAALTAILRAGPSYVMSKFGMRALTQAINTEDRDKGIRACAILPGEIDTPMMELRPAMPPPEARKQMLQPEDVAECVMLAINLPPRAVIEELLVRPTRDKFVPAAS
jgi:NAD(P)-dependent dehydrogenase (short-subunit alcohol dehydrogenase family)